MSHANTTKPASANLRARPTGPLVAACPVERKKSVEPRVLVAVRHRLGLERHHDLTVMNLLVGE